MPKSLKTVKDSVLKDNPEIRSDDIDYVLGERLGYTPSEFELHINDELDSEQEKQALKDMKKLRRGISPQYILGYAWFYGYKILVNRGVLIPRFETEELVKWTLENIDSGEKILDLGTGSGAIMVALVKQAYDKGIDNLTLYASDITDSALRESEENFLKYDLDVKTRKANVLVGLEKFDTIISNPPYIKTSEKDLMDANVIKNEPDTALYGGEDGLDFYRKFAKQIRFHLNSHGQFFLEFGFSEKRQLEELFETELPDFEIEFRDDLAGKPRMVHGRWKK
ncbi:MAG: peptide chain release factor N(5)-glutamine methyltransferase [Lactobacillus sp.]|uniref:peptide chain release factor N(5)-glutamine methyltransferase n=1 Tax=Lactobacillus sp. TaxID=1591 RepID=UPI0023BB6869|nr:peptide chain release factor N(5)-glutamine methyltransferase [Lactobacillus sp.]MDE7050989.1 peptide chain release factor N(5)-glutamine methyltransferase [Lactobacillus sp.]